MSTDISCIKNKCLFEFKDSANVNHNVTECQIIDQYHDVTALLHYVQKVKSL